MDANLAYGSGHNWSPIQITLLLIYEVLLKFVAGIRAARQPPDHETHFFLMGLLGVRVHWSFTIPCSQNAHSGIFVSECMPNYLLWRGLTAARDILFGHLADVIPFVCTLRQWVSYLEFDKKQRFGFPNVRTIADVWWSNWNDILPIGMWQCFGSLWFYNTRCCSQHI